MVRHFNTPVLLVVSLIAVVVAVYGRRSVAAETHARRAVLLYACLCCASISPVTGAIMSVTASPPRQATLGVSGPDPLHP